jgi:predicted permease
MLPIIGTLLVALQGIGTALVLTFGGLYLQRIGTLTPEHTRAISLAYKQLFLPMLLFTRTAMVLKSADDLTLGLHMTAANFVVVGVGMAVAHLLCLLVKPTSHFRKAFRVMIWMNNALALPVVLCTAVISFDERFAEDRDGAGARATGLIAFYCMSYQLFQWGVAYNQLAPDKPIELQALVSSSSSSSTVSEAIGQIKQEKDDQQSTKIKSATRADVEAQLSTSHSMTLVKHVDKQTFRESIWPWVKKRLLIPPIIGVVFGTMIGMIPFTHQVLVNSSGPLYFLFHGLAGIGSCAPPLSMVVLGAQMGAQSSTFFDASGIGGWGIVATVITGKLVLVPLCIFMLLMYMQGSGNLPADNAMRLAMVVEGLTPTANNVVVMCAIHRHGTQGVSMVLFWEYVVGMALMTIWISVALTFVLV